jgi:hypothetical protein
MSQSMFYFVLKVSPKPDTELAKEAGGAYVSCWVNFSEWEGAEHLAKFYLAKEGWSYEETDPDVRWVQRSDYVDDEENLQYFQEAEADGACFVVAQWPVNGEEDEEEQQ